MRTTTVIPSVTDLQTFWDSLGEKHRRVFLWDVDEVDLVAFRSMLEASSCFAGRNGDGSLRTLVWTAPVCRECSTNIIHFIHTGDREQAEAFAFGVFQALRRNGVRCLLAWLPLCFRHARGFARGLGFEAKAVFPRAAWLAEYGRAVDAELLTREL